MVLSATGGPAAAALPPLQHPPPGPVSQPSAHGLAQAQSHSASSEAPSAPPQITEMPTHQVGASQSGNTLHSELAGMSLSKRGSDLQREHAPASEPDQAGREQRSQRTEQVINDPLRQQQHPRDAQQGSQAAAQSPPPVVAAQSVVHLPLFTGFVSYEQLEATIGSNSYERRLASSKELPHWVKMRGPGRSCLTDSLGGDEGSCRSHFTDLSHVAIARITASHM